MDRKVSGLVFSGTYRFTISVTSPTYLIRNLRKSFREQISESAFSRELQHFFCQGGKNRLMLQCCRRHSVSCCLRKVLRIQERTGWEIETLLMLLQGENKSKVQIRTS